MEEMQGTRRKRGMRRRGAGHWYSVKRLAAFVLSFVMLFGNIGNSAITAMAGESFGSEVQFQMSVEDVWNAAKEAVSTGNRISADNFNFTQGDAEGIRALLTGGRLFEITDAVKYEAEPDTEGADLRVFILISGGDSENYSLTGKEKLIFMYMNSGEGDLRASVKIVGEETGEIVVNTGEIRVESYQEAFGENDEEEDGEKLPDQIIQMEPAPGNQNSSGGETAGSTNRVETVAGEETAGNNEETAAGEEVIAGEENSGRESDDETEAGMETGTEAGAEGGSGSTGQETLDNIADDVEEVSRPGQDDGDASPETATEDKAETEMKPESGVGEEAGENGDSHDEESAEGTAKEVSAEKPEAAEKEEVKSDHDGGDAKEPEKADTAEEKTEEKAGDAEEASDNHADADHSSDTSEGDENEEGQKLSKSENQVRIVAESAGGKSGLVAVGENTTARVTVMELSATGFVAEDEEEVPADVPGEVKKFLEAVKELPAPESVTGENAEEIIEKLYSEILSDGYALVTNSDEPWSQREAVKAACAKYEAVFAAAEKMLGMEGNDNYNVEKENSLFGRDYHIYSQNVVEELNRKTLNLNIRVGVGETVIDEGVFRFWDMSYGVYNVSSWDDFDIWSTDETVLKVTAVPNGKSLKIIYEGIADGTAQIKMAFNLTTISTGEGSVWGAGNWGGAACANCTVGTATVGTGKGNEEENKPTTKPNANNIDVYMFCDSYRSGSTHYGHAGYLSRHTDKWSLGEIVPCDWMEGYQWFCPLNMDMNKWTSFYNSVYGTHMFSMYGHGKDRTDAFNNNIPASELGFYWNGNKWEFYTGYLFIIMTEYSSQIDYTVIHEYYTNGTFDGRVKETKTDAVTGKKIYPSGLSKKTTYSGNTYEYKSGSPNPLVCSDDVTANVVTLRYERIVEEEKPTYTVTYTDGVKGETVFYDQGYEGLNEGDDTPAFEEQEGKTEIKNGVVQPKRDGYTFMGWAPAVNPVVRGADADENGNIIYTATWQKNQIPATIDDLTITKSSSNSSPKVGEEFTYTIRVNNSSESDATVKITDELSPYLTYVRSTDGGSCSGAVDGKGGIVTWDNINVPANDSKQVTITVKANTPNVEIENTATVNLKGEKQDSNKVIVNTPGEDTKYTVIYTDGENETVFNTETYRDKNLDDDTPSFGQALKLNRKGYIFTGWELNGVNLKLKNGVPVVHDKVKAEDADDNHTITYTATWKKPKLKVTKTNDSLDGFKVDTETGKAVVKYTVTVTNISGFDIYGLRITDTLDEPILTKVNEEDSGQPSVKCTFDNFEIRKDDDSEFSSAELTSGGEDDRIHVLEPLSRNEVFKDNQTVTLTYTIEIENTNDEVEVKVKLNNKVVGASWSRESSTAQPKKSRSAVMPLADTEDTDEPDVTDDASSSTGGGIGGSSGSSTEGELPRKYRVNYTWNLPEGADEELPETQKYFKDAEVTVNKDYTSTTTIKVGDTTYTFSGWSTNDEELKDAVENGKFTMPKRNVTIHGTWTPDNPDVPVPDSRHKVTVHYVYKEDGTKAADDEIRDNLAEGTEYSITSPDIDGYTPDKPVVSGMMGTEDIEITVMYTKDSSGDNGKDPTKPDPDKETITATWLPGYGDNTPIQTEDYDKGTTKVPEEDYPENPVREGYTFKGWGDPVFDEEGNITITAQWTPVSDVPNPETHKVTVHYIYANGSKAADDAVRDNLTEGTEYSITSPAISGYTPDQSIVSGTMGTEDIEITVTYTRRSSGGGSSFGGGGGGGSNTTNLSGRVHGSTPTPETPVDTAADIPDEDVPLAGIPVTDIPDADVPLAGIPDLTYIPNDDVPLASVPKTSDSSGLWHLMALLSAAGLMAISLLDKKKHQEEE